jgi:hypothetical protein
MDKGTELGLSHQRAGKRLVLQAMIAEKTEMKNNKLSFQGKMRYFLDTEFIEDGETIDLISIGLVAEDGRELYLVNQECRFERASKWVEKNVLSPMGIELYTNWLGQRKYK